MPASEPAFGLGHNLASVTDVLRDRYGGKLTAVEEIASRANAMKRTVDSDDDLPAVAEIVKDARSLRQELDKIRGEENKPHLAAQRDTNSFFNLLIERLQKIQAAFEKATGEYQDRKADEERRRLAEIARLEKEEADRKLAAAAAAQRETEGEIVLAEAERADQRSAQAQAMVAAPVADLVRTRTEHGTVSSRKGWTFAVENWAAIDLNQLRDQFSLAEIEKAVRSHVNRFHDTRPLKGVRIFESNKASFR